MYVPSIRDNKINIQSLCIIFLDTNMYSSNDYDDQGDRLYFDGDCDEHDTFLEELHVGSDSADSDGDSDDENQEYDDIDNESDEIETLSTTTSDTEIEESEKEVTGKYLNIYQCQ